MGVPHHIPPNMMSGLTNGHRCQHASMGFCRSASQSVFQLPPSPVPWGAAEVMLQRWAGDSHSTPRLPLPVSSSLQIHLFVGLGGFILIYPQTPLIPVAQFLTSPFHLFGNEIWGRFAHMVSNMGQHFIKARPCYKVTLKLLCDPAFKKYSYS